MVPRSTGARSGGLRVVLGVVLCVLAGLTSADGTLGGDNGWAFPAGLSTPLSSVYTYASVAYNNALIIGGHYYTSSFYPGSPKYKGGGDVYVLALHTGTQAVKWAWHPGANSKSSDRLRALAISGARVYAVGTAFSYKKAFVAVLNAETGAQISYWNPYQNDYSRTRYFIDALAISDDGSTLYIGGRYQKWSTSSTFSIHAEGFVDALNAQTGEGVWGPGGSKKVTFTGSRHQAVKGVACKNGQLYIIGISKSDNEDLKSHDGAWSDLGSLGGSDTYWKIYYGHNLSGVSSFISRVDASTRVTHYIRQNEISTPLAERLSDVVVSDEEDDLCLAAGTKKDNYIPNRYFSGSRAYLAPYNSVRYDEAPEAYTPPLSGITAFIRFSLNIQKGRPRLSDGWVIGFRCSTGEIRVQQFLGTRGDDNILKIRKLSGGAVYGVGLERGMPAVYRLSRNGQKQWSRAHTSKRLGTSESDETAVSGDYIGFYDIAENGTHVMAVGVENHPDNGKRATVVLATPRAPPGHYLANRWLAAQRDTSSESGGIAVVRCPVGTFSMSWDVTVCEPCEFNTFANVTGMTRCLPCPVGQVSAPGYDRCISTNDERFKTKPQLEPASTPTFVGTNGSDFHITSQYHQRLARLVLVHETAGGAKQISGDSCGAAFVTNVVLTDPPGTVAPRPDAPVLATTTQVKITALAISQPAGTVYVASFTGSGGCNVTTLMVEGETLVPAHVYPLNHTDVVTHMVVHGPYLAVAFQGGPSVALYSLNHTVGMTTQPTQVWLKLISPTEGCAISGLASYGNTVYVYGQRRSEEKGAPYEDAFIDALFQPMEVSLYQAGYVPKFGAVMNSFKYTAKYLIKLTSLSVSTDGVYFGGFLAYHEGSVYSPSQKGFWGFLDHTLTKHMFSTYGLNEKGMGAYDVPSHLAQMTEGAQWYLFATEEDSSIHVEKYAFKFQTYKIPKSSILYYRHMGKRADTKKFYTSSTNVVGAHGTNMLSVAYARPGRIGFVCTANQFFVATSLASVLDSGDGVPSELRGAGPSSVVMYSFAYPLARAGVNDTYEHPTRRMSALGCPAGTQQILFGSKCLPCPMYYHAKLGDRACSACPKGLMPNEDRTDCIDCRECNSPPNKHIRCGDCPISTPRPVLSNIDGQQTGRSGSTAMDVAFVTGDTEAAVYIGGVTAYHAFVPYNTVPYIQRYNASSMMLVCQGEIRGPAGYLDGSKTSSNDYPLNLVVDIAATPKLPTIADTAPAPHGAAEAGGVGPSDGFVYVVGLIGAKYYGTPVAGGQGYFGYNYGTTEGGFLAVMDAHSLSEAGSYVVAKGYSEGPGEADVESATMWSVAIDPYTPRRILVGGARFLSSDESRATLWVMNRAATSGAVSLSARHDLVMVKTKTQEAFRLVSFTKDYLYAVWMSTGTVAKVHRYDRAALMGAQGIRDLAAPIRQFDINPVGIGGIYSDITSLVAAIRPDGVEYVVVGGHSTVSIRSAEHNKEQDPFFMVIKSGAEDLKLEYIHAWSKSLFGNTHNTAIPAGSQNDRLYSVEVDRRSGVIIATGALNIGVKTPHTNQDLSFGFVDSKMYRRAFINVYRPVATSTAGFFDYAVSKQSSVEVPKSSVINRAFEFAARKARMVSNRALVLVEGTHDFGTGPDFTSRNVIYPGTALQESAEMVPRLVHVPISAPGAIVYTRRLDRLVPTGQIPCPLGKYMDEYAFESRSGSVDCKQCAAHHITATQGSASCTPCPIGYYSDDNLRCVHCEAGWYGLGEGKGCAKCAAGTASAEIGRTSSCPPCPPGRFASLTAQTECKQCHVGHISAVSGGQECAACSAGWYAATAGSTSCSKCAIGFYSTSTGSSTCEQCPNGATTVSEAQPTIQSCVCGANEFGVPVGSDGSLNSTTACQVCPNNAECPFRTANPEAKSGYYLHEDDPYNVLSCFPAGACTGGTATSGVAAAASARRNSERMATLEVGDTTTLATTNESPDVCAVGYSGKACNKCATGYYRAARGECDICSAVGLSNEGSIALRVVVFLGLTLVSMSTCGMPALIFYLNMKQMKDDLKGAIEDASEIKMIFTSCYGVLKKRGVFLFTVTKRFLKLLSKFLQYVQIAGIVFTINVRWNTALTWVATLSSFGTVLDASTIQADCLFGGNLTFEERFVWTVVSPIFMCAVASIIAIATSAILLCIRKICPMGRMARRALAIAAVREVRYTLQGILMLSNLFYVPLHVLALSPFICHEQSDGVYVVMAEPQVQCFTEGAWMTLVPVGLLAIIAFSLGIPIFLTATSICLHKLKPAEDDTASSDQNIESFKDGGGEAPIVFLPPGVDADEFTYGAPTSEQVGNAGSNVNFADDVSVHETGGDEFPSYPLPPAPVDSDGYGSPRSTPRHSSPRKEIPCFSSDAIPVVDLDRPMRVSGGKCESVIHTPRAGEGNQTREQSMVALEHEASNGAIDDDGAEVLTRDAIIAELAEAPIFLWDPYKEEMYWAEATQLLLKFLLGMSLVLSMASVVALMVWMLVVSMIYMLCIARLQPFGSRLDQMMGTSVAVATVVTVIASFLFTEGLDTSSAAVRIVLVAVTASHALVILFVIAGMIPMIKDILSLVVEPVRMMVTWIKSKMCPPPLEYDSDDTSNSDEVERPLESPRRTPRYSPKKVAKNSADLMDEISDLDEDYLGGDKPLAYRTEDLHRRLAPFRILDATTTPVEMEPTVRAESGRATESSGMPLPAEYYDIKKPPRLSDSGISDG